ncbi:hypothetical protein D3C72_1468720 [compost metagenome]
MSPVDFICVCSQKNGWTRKAGTYRFKPMLAKPESLVQVAGNTPSHTVATPAMIARGHCLMGVLNHIEKKTSGIMKRPCGLTSMAAAVRVAAGISQLSSTVSEMSSIIMVMMASTWPHTADTKITTGLKT